MVKLQAYACLGLILVVQLALTAALTWFAETRAAQLYGRLRLWLDKTYDVCDVRAWARAAWASILIVAWLYGALLAFRVSGEWLAARRPSVFEVAVWVWFVGEALILSFWMVAELILPRPSPDPEQVRP